MLNNKSLIDILSEIKAGIDLLMDSCWNDFLSSSNQFVSSCSPSIGFNDAKKRFMRAEAIAASILNSSKLLDGINGKSVLAHIRQIELVKDIPFKWAMEIYNDEEASPEDLELAYQMYDSYVTSVSRLKDVLTKIRSGEIKVKWIPGTEPSSIPEIEIPKVLNRKTVSTS